MTLLIAGMCTLVCLAVGSFAIDVTSTFAQRARAQTAADAAALAAVAEGTPYGAGDPRSAAVRFAELNGARVTNCLCDRGATAVQVTVSVEGVVARARAVFEPDLMGPGLPSLQGLHPSLRRSVDLLLARGRIRRSRVRIPIERGPGSFVGEGCGPVRRPGGGG